MTAGAIAAVAGTRSDAAEADAGGLHEKAPLRKVTRLRAKQSGYVVGTSGTSKAESESDADEWAPDDARSHAAMALALEGANLTRLVKTSGAEIGPGGPV